MKNVIQQIDRYLCDLTQFCANLKRQGKSTNKYKIKFPRGVIRTVNDIKKDLPNFLDETLATNIAYTLEITDIYRWLCVRTDIKGVVRDMIFKEVLCKYAQVTESIIKHYVGSKNVSFNEAIARLENKNVIDDKLSSSLKVLWEKRQGHHLYLVEERELNKYNERLINQNIRVFNKFLQTMKNIE